MAGSESLVERAQPYISDQGQIRYAFKAYTGRSPFLGGTTSATLKNWIFAVTDTGINILKAGKYRSGTPSALSFRFDRGACGIKLGVLWCEVKIAGEIYYVHARFKRELEAMLAEQSTTSASTASSEYASAGEASAAYLQELRERNRSGEMSDEEYNAEKHRFLFNE